MTNSKNDGKLSTKREVDWICVIFNLQIYVSCLCGLHFILNDAYIVTSIFGLFLVLLTSLGVTAGAHRLWAHQSYTASTSLKIFLMICQTLAAHTPIYDWVRLHRLHHKYYRTDLDPYNPVRGFVYSHFLAGNLKLSPAQEKALEQIDMSDLENDNVVMFQKKYYWVLVPVISLLLPINAPVEYWGESVTNSVFIVGWLRLGISYHLSTLIYSATTVFDLNQEERDASDSNLVFFITKTYWLSYHYLAPWDYQTSEYGKYGNDCSSMFIRVCAALELATDLKTIAPSLVREALKVSVDENRPISDCLYEVYNNSNELPEDHYLTPSKYY